MAATWVSFKQIKADVAIEAVLERYGVRLRRIGEEGLRIWEECLARTRATEMKPAVRQPLLVREDSPGYGTPQLVQPRLGQGIFRVAVMDAYSRACAVTQARGSRRTIKTADRTIRHGSSVSVPTAAADAPSVAFLRWHNERVYRAT